MNRIGRKIKPATLDIDITGQQTNLEYIASGNLTLDQAYKRCIGLFLVRTRKTFNAAFGKDASKIDENTKISIESGADGEIIKDLNVKRLLFDDSCPVEQRILPVEPFNAAGTRVTVTVTKDATATDQDGDAIGNTIESTYQYQVGFILENPED